MSASTASRPVERGETKVCPGKGPAVEVVEVGSDVRKEAERDAERLLRITAKLGAPVEPAGIANRLGVQVLETEFDDDIFGGLLMQPGDDPKILLNRKYGLIRQRLTCAGELGHYIRRSTDDRRFAHIDGPGEPSASSKDPDDAYAAEFRASLLMPKEVVQTWAEIGMDDLEMALKFVVSREAVQPRLRSLGIDALDLRVA
jgi:Zn-dependent peptidase ImmA (M78 family)